MEKSKGENMINKEDSKVEDKKKYDELGREIVAENVHLVFSGYINTEE